MSEAAEKSTTWYGLSGAENLRSVKCNFRKGPTERNMVPQLPSTKRNMTKSSERDSVGPLGGHIFLKTNLQRFNGLSSNVACKEKPL